MAISSAGTTCIYKLTTYHLQRQGQIRNLSLRDSPGIILIAAEMSRMCGGGGGGSDRVVFPLCSRSEVTLALELNGFFV